MCEECVEILAMCIIDPNYARKKVNDLKHEPPQELLDTLGIRTEVKI